MKRIFITLILSGLVINSYSQLKHFFPDSNSYFSVSYMKFWFQGDTIIENSKYKKVYMQMNDSIADFNKAHYFSAIREDTITEKVYCIYDDEEYLLYDFSLNVGNTANFYSFWFCWRPCIKKQVVKSIDSIFIDNHYRKRINFDSEHSGIESWIEGIGSTHGLFFAGYFDVVDAMDWTELLCVHIDGRIIYQIENNCHIKKIILGYDIKEKENKIFRIYPTITDNLLYIETDENIEDFDYNIVNTQGQIIKKGLFISDILDVSTLNKGFYLVQISNNKKKNIKTHKLIKY